MCVGMYVMMHVCEWKGGGGGEGGGEGRFDNWMLDGALQVVKQLIKV